MAHQVEPMDIDSSVCDFDDKENAFHHNNVLRTPCTEKGYEELDVTELNMKLRYSITPATSPMSKSFTANCFDNRVCELDNAIDCENANMTRSLHSTLKNDTFNKSHKTLPLQVLSTDHGQITDGSRNVLQPLDSTIAVEKTVTVTVTGPNDIDENISLPSSSSSLSHTPEAPTPTNEIPKSEVSPIMRGLKSIVNMFRPSQSPIPGEDESAKLELLSPPIVNSPDTSENNQSVSISTPLVGHTTKDPLTKKNSLNKESVVFSEGLQKDLEWSDDSIIFSNEKIPVHKLFFQQPMSLDAKRTINMTNPAATNETEQKNQEKILNETLEYMDISYNDSAILDKTANKAAEAINRNEVSAIESDSEFLDCESTLTKDESFKSQVNTLDSTEDVLSHIDDLVEAKSFNSTTETLSVSDIKSTNISAVSTITAKSTSVCNESDSINLHQIITEEIKKADPVKPSEEENVVVSDKVEFDKNTVQAINPVNITNNSNAIVDSPVMENMGVNSISQIPLIVDPRVLLFNMPPVVSNNETNANNIVDPPVIENMDVKSDASDKVDFDKNTIQAINPVETNITNTIVNSPVMENMGVKSISQIPLIVDPRVLLFNIPPVVSNNETNNQVNTSPADVPLPEDDDMPSLPVMNSELEILSHTLDKIAEEIPKINQHEIIVENFVQSGDSTPNDFVKNLSEESDTIKEPVLSKTEVSGTIEARPQILKIEPVVSEKQDINKTKNAEIIYEVNLLAATSDVSGKPKPIPVEIKTEDQNSEKLSKFLDDVNKPISVSPDVKFELLSAIPENVNKVENILNKCLLTSKPPSNSEVSNELANIQKEPEFPIESMDVDGINIQKTIESDELQTMIGEGVITNSSFLGVTSNNSPEVNDNTGDGAVKHNQFNENEEQKSVSMSVPEISKNVTATPKHFVQVNDDSYEFIKHEIDSIINQAVAIASEKSAVTNSSEIIKNNTQVENKANSTEVLDANINIEGSLTNALKSEMQLAEQNLSSNKVTVDKCSSVSTNSIQITAQEYNITEQQDVSPALLFTGDTKVTDTPSEISETIQTETEKFEQTEIKESADNTVNNNITPTEIEMESEKVEDVTPPEEIEPVVTADDEISVSVNNSPYLLIQNEIEDDIEHKPIGNFDERTIVVTTPPLSPKIVSKGYNFNFDEIDDPFATKTKIRMSPALDISQNQTLEQELSKRDVNKNSRCKSQPEKRRPPVNTQKLNSTFGGKMNNTGKSALSIAKDMSPNLGANIENKEKSDLSQDLIVETDPKDIVKSDPLNKTQEVSNSAENDQQKILFESNPDVTIETDRKDIVKSEPLNKTQEVSNSAENDQQKILFESIPDDTKNSVTSSLEQSTYFSAATSSEEVIDTIIEINVPLDDSINPFATKSKISNSPSLDTMTSPLVTRSRVCVTPPPNLDDINPFATKSKIRSSTETLAITKDSVILDDFVTVDEIANKPDLLISNTNIGIEASGNELELPITPSLVEKEKVIEQSGEDEKDSLKNTSGTTCSSINDKDCTVREVNTEDEDTLEGPFLEADLPNNDKFMELDVENDDMMRFSNVPQFNDGNQEAGELFIDAEAFEFLLNQNQANTVTDSGKESLFLKFDPLFAKRLSSDGVLAALKHAQTTAKQSTPKKENPPILKDAMFDISSPVAVVAGPSDVNLTHEMYFNSTVEESSDDLNVTVSKPMMVVNPAVNPVVTPRNKTMTPNRSNRQSLRFTSPAIAVIDRLLSMSTSNNSFMTHDTTVAEFNRDNEADLALTQLRELLADKEINVYSLRSETKELQNRLANLESQMKSLEAISEERLKKINELNEKLNEKSTINKSMAKVVEEYERTIASLIAETEQDRTRHAEERLQLIKERDEQTAHLASMEVSFSDLHSKYEKSKQVLIGFKSNEDACKKSIKEFEDNLAKMKKNYELLKQHATAKLNDANEELQKINRTHEAEMLKLNALIKRKDLHITSLEETLQQKTKANEELTAICDELINKVG